MGDRPFLYPYFDKATFSSESIEAIIGGNTDEAIRAFINRDESYEKDTLFYNGLFKAQPLKFLIKTVYGIFLFQDNYHDFTDTDRVDTKGLLYAPLDKNVGTFYTHVIKYTTQPWFFEMYTKCDKIINQHKKGDRKEDTIIRLFQTNGGEALWSELFGADNPLAAKVLKYFFIDKVFLGNIPVVRKIGKAEIETLNVNSIRHDFFFEFTLDKVGLTPKQRKNFTETFRSILDTSLYGPSVVKEKTPVTSDATSFPYKYTGINEFIDNFAPKASAQTLWDGASMDTFGGKLVYDETSNLPKEARELQSVRSGRWSVQFSKKRGGDIKHSEYNVTMTYADGSMRPAALNTSYSLSSGSKGFTVKHMFEHAAYLKYCIDYKAAVADAKDKDKLFAHISTIYRLLLEQAAAAAASGKKGKHMMLPPLISPQNIAAIDMAQLQSLLIVPIDGKGSCDADQAIYASYRRYGFTTLDALCYFSGILNRANSAYVVSTIGRIRAAKFMKDQRTLEDQKRLLEMNKIALRFKELVNMYIRVRSCIKSIVDSYNILESGDVYYKNDSSTKKILGDIFRAFFIYKLHVNKDTVLQIRLADASYMVMTQIIDAMVQFIPGATTFARRLNTLNNRIDAIFWAMQQSDLFASPLPELGYVLYKKIGGEEPADMKPFGEATYADLFGHMYNILGEYIATVKGRLMYKKGKDEFIKLDTFNVMNLTPGHSKLAHMQYLIVNNKKYVAADNEGQFNMDGMLERIDTLEVGLKTLSMAPELAFNRSTQKVCDNIIRTLNDALNIEIDVDYERMNTSDALETISGTVNDLVARILADDQSLFASGVLPFGQSGGRVSVAAGQATRLQAEGQATRLQAAGPAALISSRAKSLSVSVMPKQNMLEFIVNNIDAFANNVKLKRNVYGVHVKYMISFIMAVLIAEEQLGVEALAMATATGGASPNTATQYADILSTMQYTNNIISYELNDYVSTIQDEREIPEMLQSKAIIAVNDMLSQLGGDAIMTDKRAALKGHSISDIMQYMLSLASDPCKSDARGVRFNQATDLYDLKDISVDNQGEFIAECVAQIKIMDHLLKCIKFEVCDAATVAELTQPVIVGVKRKFTRSRSRNSNSGRRTVKRPRSKLRINNKA